MNLLLHGRMSESAGLPPPPAEFNTDKSLAELLMEMTFEDRTTIEEEIHGVACRAMNENSALVQKALDRFDEQLNKRKESDSIDGCATTSGLKMFTSCKKLLRNVVRISSKNSFSAAATTTTTTTEDSPVSTSIPSKQPFSSNTAILASNDGITKKQRNCYLNDRNLRLRFLRCECFDVDKAVEKLIQFLDLMCELYGDYVCERPIKLSDFNREEETALMNSRNQYLPFRDRSGRRIMCAVGGANHHLGLKLRYKILTFLQWVVSEDVETQQKGIVIAGWIFNESKKENNWETLFQPNMHELYKLYHLKMIAGFPVRVVGWHHYYADTPFFRFLAGLYVYSIRNAPHMSFYRLHFGKSTEILYKMSSYGFPVDLVPVTSSGELKFSNQCAWVNVVRTIEHPSQQDRDKIIVECPRSYDVVFRKGKTHTNNPGNVYYRHLIEEHSAAHLEGDKAKKFEITMKIVRIIEERSGRFLEWSKSFWVVMKDRNSVRKKIAAAFKQKNRKDSGKLSKTIEIVDSIANDDLCSEGNPLKDYYNLAHPSKRRKTHASCFDNKACFGKMFFPIDSNTKATETSNHSENFAIRTLIHGSEEPIKATEDMLVVQ